MLRLVPAHSSATEETTTPSAGEFGIWTAYRLPQDRADWHPLVRRLYDYWRSIAPPGRLPGRQHVAPEDIAPLWSRMFLLDVSRNPLRYRYRLCGTGVVRSLEREVTGGWLDEVHPQLIADPDARGRLRFVVETGHPTWRRGPTICARDPEHRTIEGCIVPLAADGVTVDMLMGVVVAFDAAGKAI